MNGYIVNIEEVTLENHYFREVLYTAKNTQLVLMSLKAGEDIGEEVHNLDQFIRLEQGEGKVVLNGVEHDISDGMAVVVPAGVRHNIINTSPSLELKLYSLYSPPDHKDGTLHINKDEALADTMDHFDGKTTE